MIHAESRLPLLYLSTIGLPLAGIARAMSKADAATVFGMVIPSLTERSEPHLFCIKFY